MNMMSGHLCTQYALAARSSQCHLMGCRDAYPYGVSVHGAAANFCAGAYIPAPGTAAPFDALISLMYDAFVSCRRIVNTPTLCALHGLVVGGGVALALNMNVRVAAFMSTISFGNLSRGAVPGMLLAVNVVRSGGFARAVAFYLADSMIHASDAYNLGICAGYSGNVIAANTDIFRLGALGPATQHATSATLYSKFMVQRAQNRVVLSTLWKAIV